MKVKNFNHQDQFVPKNDLILASVIPPDEPINGFAQNDLGDIWWQTFYAIPADQNPSEFDDNSDPQGVKGSSQKASLTRIDSIQFLAGAVVETNELPFTATATRTIKVPGGSVFFFPILNAVSPDPYLDEDGNLAGGIGGIDQEGNPITEKGVKQDLNDLLSGIVNLKASIDGVPIPNLFDYRQQSDQPFSFNLPENNILDIPVNPPGETFGGVLADGYWVGIGNLSPEDHVIKFQGFLEFDPENAGADFVLDITYKISFDLNEIKGTNRRDYLTGTNGWDEINGFNGNDYIVGQEGNDALYGGRGADTLIGTNPHFRNPRRGEIDILNGGEGEDTFVLGDSRRTYYKGKGLQDYAIIKDFNKHQDSIQLHGNHWWYELSETYSLGGKSGTSIFLKNTHELIGFIEGEKGLNLASNDFSFVCH